MSRSDGDIPGHSKDLRDGSLSLSMDGDSPIRTPCHSPREVEGDDESPARDLSTTPRFKDAGDDMFMNI